MKKITDSEFIELWHQHKSATKLSEITGISVRNIHSRRRSIEGRHGMQLSSNIKVTIPQNGIRVGAEIDSGVVLVGSDAHYWPDRISTAHRAFVLLAKELNPAAIIMNGDVLDGATISRHDRIQWEYRPSVQHELEAAQERLGEIEAVAKKAKLHWTWGNHDMRFNSCLSAHAGQFEGVKGFNLADHFPRWTFSTSVMINKHTMIKHRWHNGVHATYNNVLKSGTSMVTGHLHALQVKPHTDYNGTRYAVDTGTLASVYGDQFVYTEDSPANNRSGFAVLTFHNGKLMPPELLEVIDDEMGLVFFRGHILEV